MTTTPDGAGGSAAELMAALRIERGSPAPEELAALTVVLHRLRNSVAAVVPPPPEPHSSWADPTRRLRVTPTAGPHGWRDSTLPR